MRKLAIFTMIVSLGFSAGTGPAAAKQSLQSVAVVENGLFAVAVADKIRRECDTISARLLKAHNMLRSLYNTARAEGYTDDEIDAYVKSDTQKKRMEAKRDAYLSKQGVVKSAPESYCAAGRAEIQKSSQIGALLKAR